MFVCVSRGRRDVAADGDRLCLICAFASAFAGAGVVEVLGILLS
jgi:hypothetical protein